VKAVGGQGRRPYWLTAMAVAKDWGEAASLPVRRTRQAARLAMN
jgi:hypothetical protein